MTDDLRNFILLHPRDNVIVCCGGVQAGQGQVVDGTPLRVTQRIGIGHKVARVSLRAGDLVIKLGAVIGTITKDTPRGGHVHMANMKSNYIPSHTRHDAPRASRNQAQRQLDASETNDQQRVVAVGGKGLNGGRAKAKSRRAGQPLGGQE